MIGSVNMIIVDLNKKNIKKLEKILAFKFSCDIIEKMSVQG